MAAPYTIADVLADVNDNVTREIIGNNAFEIGRTLDPVFRDIIVTSFDKTGDTPDGNFTPGRDLKVRRRFHKGMTGVIQGGEAANHFTLVGGGVDKFGADSWQFKPNQTSAFPDALQGAMQGAFGMAFTLYSITFNLPLPLELLRLEANPANIKDQLEPHLRGFGRNLAQYFTNQWYVNGSSSYRLGTLPAAQSDIEIDTTNKTIKFVPQEGTAFRFAVGMTVDLYSSGGTRLNIRDGGTSTDDSHRVLVLVHAVDPFTDEVTLVAHPDDVDVSASTATFSGGESSSGGDTDGWAAYNDGFANVSLVSGYVRYATGGSSPSGMYGWRHWTKWGGSTNNDKRLLGSDHLTGTDEYIDVDVHTSFKSGHFDLNGQSLTEVKLVDYLARADKAEQMYGHMFDTVIGSPFVAEDIMVQMLAKSQIQRTPGTPVNISNLGLGNSFSFTRNGRNWNYITSHYMEEGNVLIMRLKDNWTMVMPNEPNQVQQGNIEGNLSQFPLSFVMPALTGNNSRIFPYLTANSEVTGMAQMPGYVHAQFAPKNQTAAIFIENAKVRKQTIDA